MNVQKVALWAVIVPLFLIPFIALYVANGLYFPFIAGKHFAFRVLVEIALAGWAVLALTDRRYRPQFSWVMVSFALLLVWMLVADLSAINPHKALWSNFERMDGWVTLVHVFALFLVAGPVLQIQNLWRKWWLTLVGVAGILTAHGLLQMAGVLRIHQSDTRIDASLGNSEYLAGFLLLAIGITVWQAFASKAAWLRYGLFALAVLEVVALLATGTRGTFIALVVAAVFGGFAWLLTQGARAKKGALIFLAALVVLVGGFYAVRGTAFVQESPNLSRFANISLGSLETRFTIWDMAVEGIKERPLLGWGHEGFNYVFNKYYDPSLYGQEAWFDRAHSVYLDWAIAGGIPALLLFLALGIAAAFAIYRAKELAPWERAILLTTLVGYSVQGLAVFDNLFTYVPIALLLAYVHMRSARPIKVLERVPELRGGAADLVAAPIAAILAVLVIYMVNVPTYAAGKELINALRPQHTPEARLAAFKRALAREPFATQEIREQLLMFGQSLERANAPREFKQEALVFAAREMDKEIARAPQDARLFALHASFFRSLGGFDLARATAAKARTLSPQKQGIIIEQGLIEWQAGNKEAARAFFDEAHALAPENAELTTYAAVGRIITNDIPGGKALLAERFGTTTVNDLLLALAYQESKAWDDLIALLRVRYAETQEAMRGYQLAAAYGQAGRVAEATTLAREIVAAHPETAAAAAALLKQFGVQ